MAILRISGVVYRIGWSLAALFAPALLPLLVFAADHVYWTETIPEVANNHAVRAANGGATPGEVWLLGTVSDRTSNELSKLGIDIHENVATMMVATES